MNISIISAALRDKLSGMKTETITKLFLGIIACALVVLAGESFIKPVFPVQAAARQQWDYKILNHTRQNDQNSGEFVEAFYEDDKEAKFTSMTARAQQLGAEGWELVSAEPRSIGGGSSFFATPGSTSSEIWIFKRPK
jgi:hypothetical protein